MKRTNRAKKGTLIKTVEAIPLLRKYGEPLIYKKEILSTDDYSNIILIDGQMGTPQEFDLTHIKICVISKDKEFLEDFWLNGEMDFGFLGRANSWLKIPLCYMNGDLYGKRVLFRNIPTRITSNEHFWLELKLNIPVEKRPPKFTIYAFMEGTNYKPL